MLGSYNNAIEVYLHWEILYECVYLYIWKSHCHDINNPFFHIHNLISCFQKHYYPCISIPVFLLEIAAQLFLEEKKVLYKITFIHRSQSEQKHSITSHQYKTCALSCFCHQVTGIGSFCQSTDINRIFRKVRV